MSNENQEPKEGQKKIDKKWNSYEGDPEPGWDEVQKVARQAWETAFGSPGKLRIVGVKSHC